MSPEIKKMQDHLNALKLFLASPAHAGHVAARTQEIKEVEERILLLRPDSQDNIARILEAFGELDCLGEMLVTFENAALTLKTRIDEALDREQQQGSTTKV